MKVNVDMKGISLLLALFFSFCFEKVFASQGTAFNLTKSLIDKRKALIPEIKKNLTAEQKKEIEVIPEAVAQQLKKGGGVSTKNEYELFDQTISEYKTKIEKASVEDLYSFIEKKKFDDEATPMSILDKLEIDILKTPETAPTEGVAALTNEQVVILIEKINLHCWALLSVRAVEILVDRVADVNALVEKRIDKIISWMQTGFEKKHILEMQPSAESIFSQDWFNQVKAVFSSTDSTKNRLQYLKAENAELIDLIDNLLLDKLIVVIKNDVSFDDRKEIAQTDAGILLHERVKAQMSQETQDTLVNSVLIPLFKNPMEKENYPDEIAKDTNKKYRQTIPQLMQAWMIYIANAFLRQSRIDQADKIAVHECIMEALRPTATVFKEKIIPQAEKIVKLSQSAKNIISYAVGILDAVISDQDRISISIEKDGVVKTKKMDTLIGLYKKAYETKQISKVTVVDAFQHTIAQYAQKINSETENYYRFIEKLTLLQDDIQKTAMQDLIDEDKAQLVEKIGSDCWALLGKKTVDAFVSAVQPIEALISDRLSKIASWISSGKNLKNMILEKSLVVADRVMVHSDEADQIVAHMQSIIAHKYFDILSNEWVQKYASTQDLNVAKEKISSLCNADLNDTRAATAKLTNPSNQEKKSIVWLLLAWKNYFVEYVFKNANKNDSAQATKFIDLVIRKIANNAKIMLEAMSNLLIDVTQKNLAIEYIDNLTEIANDKTAVNGKQSRTLEKLKNDAYAK